MRKSSSFLWFFLLILPGILQAESPLFPYRAYTDAHVDIGFRLIEGQLEGYWKNDDATVDGHPTAEDFSAHEIRALGIFDANTPPLIRPAGSQWDFFGVAAGEPIYILPSSGVPDTLPYLGFSTEHPSVGTYEDFRISLISMTGPPGGVFTLYTSATNRPMTASVGTGTASGTLAFEGGEHHHYNWAFSQLGTYDLTFRFEILDANPPLLTYQTFRFQITDGGTYDDYPHWHRTHFRPDHINDDAISGPSVNAVNALGETLGFTNAQRYAFGNDPTVELLFVEDAGVLWPAVRLHMRTGMTDLQTQPEFTTSLTQGEWTSDSLILVEDDPVFHDPGLKERIYRLDHFPSGPLFFRAGSTSSE